MKGTPQAREIADSRANFSADEALKALVKLNHANENSLNRNLDRNRSACSIGNNSTRSNYDTEDGCMVVTDSKLPDDKREYFKWRESWTSYEDFDSRLEENETRRRQLSITALDERKWRDMKDAAFIVEF